MKLEEQSNHGFVDRRNVNSCKETSKYRISKMSFSLHTMASVGVLEEGSSSLQSGDRDQIQILLSRYSKRLSVLFELRNYVGTNKKTLCPEIMLLAGCPSKGKDHQDKSLIPLRFVFYDIFTMFFLF